MHIGMFSYGGGGKDLLKVWCHIDTSGQNPSPDFDLEMQAILAGLLEKENGIIKLAPRLYIAPRCKNSMLFQCPGKNDERIPKISLTRTQFHRKSIWACLGYSGQLVFIEAHLNRLSLVCEA